MSRAVAVAFLGGTLLLGACSAGGGKPAVVSPACPLIARLAQTGQAVASADVSKPEVFDATLKRAVTAYVQTATRLRTAVPDRLRVDVDRMITAARQYRFTDAIAARQRVDSFARAVCDSGASRS